ncbi:hypothetical protein BRADI_1g55796v3 [Brachypodium distachyon]|uniref:Uncharacterized protein n=1 Tax=Brachypodium distachyon TaxID=15368 RepID=A0A0Q3HCM5_BRADI|nr:hypothetical protein BRADI_1g55796v3 [Brachypodium distachyon]
MGSFFSSPVAVEEQVPKAHEWGLQGCTTEELIDILRREFKCPPDAVMMRPPCPCAGFCNQISRNTSSSSSHFPSEIGPVAIAALRSMSKPPTKLNVVQSVDLV